MDLTDFEYRCQGSLFIKAYLNYNKTPPTGTVKGGVLLIQDDGKLYFRSYEQQKVIRKINNWLSKNEEKLLPLTAAGFVSGMFPCIYKCEKNNMYRAIVKNFSNYEDVESIELIDFGIVLSVNKNDLFLVPAHLLLVRSPLIYMCRLTTFKKIRNIQNDDIEKLKTIISDNIVFCTFLSNNVPYDIDLDMITPDLKGFINVLLCKNFSSK